MNESERTATDDGSYPWKMNNASIIIGERIVL
jgi:hypothetical protein